MSASDISDITRDVLAADHLMVPDWHRPWIAEHAAKIAQQTFLAAISDAPSIETWIWEAAGHVVIHDVHRALVLTEDADTIRHAALFGAEHFLRVFFDLVFTSGRGGRA